MSDKSYLVIYSSGDGDFAHQDVATQQEADAVLEGEDGWSPKYEGSYGVIEIDWEKRTFNRTVHCQ